MNQFCYFLGKQLSNGHPRAQTNLAKATSTSSFLSISVSTSKKARQKSVCLMILARSISAKNFATLRISDVYMTTCISAIIIIHKRDLELRFMFRGQLKFWKPSYSLFPMKPRCNLTRVFFLTMKNALYKTSISRPCV